MVCGITLLDKDHMHFLGGSVESMAWHKAGIFKVIQLKNCDVLLFDKRNVLMQYRSRIS